MLTPYIGLLAAAAGTGAGAAAAVQASPLIVTGGAEARQNVPVEFVLSINGTANTATILIEHSDDGSSYTTFMTVSLVGPAVAGNASQQFVASLTKKFVRANVSAISAGTVTVNMMVR